MKKPILFISLFFCITLSFGQSIKGKIVVENDQFISNVNVLLVDTNKGATTNDQGEFEIKNVTPGSYTLKITSIGYKTELLPVTLSKNETKELTITLQKSNEQLGEVLITTDQKTYAAKEPSSSLRLKSALIKTPQNIQVISADLLKDQQAYTMMESVSRNVSGATMIEHWGNFARINMRGFKIPAFRNGMNVEMTWGPLAEDMSMIERIEFVKGPAGFMLAAGQPGGFYNVVTKKPSPNRILEASFAVGSFDTYRGTLDYGDATANGKLQYRINAMASTEESHRPFEKSSRISVVPSLKYEFSDKTSLTTEFTYQEADMPLGSAYVFAPIAVGFGGLDRDFSAIDTNFPTTEIEELGTFTNFTHRFNSNWEFQAQYSYIKYDQEGATPWPLTVEENGDMVRGVSIWDALGETNILQLFGTGSFNTAQIHHNVLVGFDYNKREYWADWAQGGAIDDAEDPFNIFNPVYGNAVMPIFDRSESIKTRGQGGHQGITSRGYYLQDEIGFFNEKLRLTLAGRYTNADIFSYGTGADASKFTPRFGLSYDILPTFTVYGLYDESFYPQQGLSATGKSFDPEESSDIEGGLKKSWFNGRLNSSLTAYKITKDNVLVGDPENINYSIQLGQVESKGFEFDIQGKITPQLNVVLNYANTNVEITKDTNPDNIGTKVAGHAKHVTNGWANYTFTENNFLKGFGASLGYQFQADRSSWNWAADNESELPDYFRLDGGVSWQNRHFNVRLNVNNILNKYLYSGSAYATYMYWQSEPGTNARLSITYKL